MKVKGSSGFSMIVVLAVMLLLFAIGLSALAAAGATAGARVSQYQYNKLTVYAESVNQCLVYSMQDDTDAAAAGFTALGSQLVKAAYEHMMASPPPTEDAPLPEWEKKLTAELAGADGIPVEVRVSLTDMETVPVYDAPDSISVRAKAAFTVTAGQGDDMVIYQMTFRLVRGAELALDADKKATRVIDAGDWRVVSYEKLDKELI